MDLLCFRSPAVEKTRPGRSHFHRVQVFRVRRSYPEQSTSPAYVYGLRFKELPNGELRLIASQCVPFALRTAERAPTAETIFVEGCCLETAPSGTCQVHFIVVKKARMTSQQTQYTRQDQVRLVSRDKLWKHLHKQRVSRVMSQINMFKCGY
ncbi:hypothetical protein MTO96_039983 [Rhipicephalus appendiculatus]